MTKKSSHKSPNLFIKSKRAIRWLKPTSPAKGMLLFIVSFVVVGGIFFAFKSFAIYNGPLVHSGRKDPNYCPLDYDAKPTLRRGNSQGCVYALQGDLANFWNNGGLQIDGQFGPTTQNYVKLFQAYQGIPADGVVGPQTWNYLGCALSAKFPYDSFTGIYCNNINVKLK